MRALLAAVVIAWPCVAGAANLRMDGNDGVALSGTILPGDSIRFKQFVDGAEATGASIERVTLDSGGGFLDEAGGIAQSIAGFRLDTEIKPGATCASACTILFASGRRRIYHEGAHFGVHQSRLTTGAASPEGTALENKWLTTFKVPQRILDRLAATPPNQIAWMTDNEMKDMVLLYVTAGGSKVVTMPWMGEWVRSQREREKLLPTKESIALAATKLKQEYPWIYERPTASPKGH